MKTRVARVLLVASILVFLVGCPGLFEKPLTLSIPDQEVLQGDALVIELLDHVSGGRGTLVFNIEEGVGEIDGSAYTYTPGYDVFDDQTVKIRVKDDRDESVEDTFEITVEAFEVEFEDENLEAVVRESIGKPEGSIYKGEVEGIIHLFASWREISSLKGIEHLTNLRSFTMQFHQVDDLSPLSGLTDLRRLLLCFHEISDFSPVSSLVKLEELWLQNTGLADLSFLSEMNQLSIVRITSNNVTDVSHLLDLDNLNRLYIHNNPTGFIDGTLIDLAPLEGIGVDMNQLQDLQTIEHLGSLSILQIIGAGTRRLQDIEFVGEFDNLKNLTNLSLLFNSIVDITPLSALVNLQSLYLSYNQIVSLEALQDLQDLTVLFLTRNRVKEISHLQDLVNLRTLYLNENEIIDISALENLSNIFNLQLEWNEVTDISPLVANTGVGSGDYVTIRNNYLDLIPGSQNMLDIEALIARGVNVSYQPQRDPEESPGSMGNYLENELNVFLSEEVYEGISLFEGLPVK